MTHLSDEISFELPTAKTARALQIQLTLEGAAERAQEDEVWIVSVELDETTDLAHLLRVVERYVLRGGLGAIRYHLDGRAYVLDAGEASWPWVFADVAAKAATDAH